ncbi:hypothetical protein F442_14680 [Phytophthora nicotianae P10297]|uniref:DDE Tnp4 domain-containing protein n=2 Tax=Phytophthora nicotianae TaxID=4792 RepID=W2YS85_PHYNI|nr:hypothetical protein F442_14680 [Phytophthora nicotianae P10297]
MTYTGRYGDLCCLFGRSGPVICMIFNFMLRLVYVNFKSLLAFESGLPTTSRLEAYADAVRQRGAPEPKYIGFIDDTVRGIACPSINQKQVYNGHERKPVLKYQGVMIPDGLFIEFYGPCVGRRHDSWLLRQSGLLNILPHVLNDGYNTSYCIYGDPAYPMKPNLQVGFKGSKLTEDQIAFNAAMSKVRIAVEWGFGGIARFWPCLDMRLSQKLYLSPLMSNAMALLKNDESQATLNDCNYKDEKTRSFLVGDPEQPWTKT